MHVYVAISNISVLSQTYIHVKTSSDTAITFRCIAGCAFEMRWIRERGKWKCATYVEHTCPADPNERNNRKAKNISFSTQFIDIALNHLGAYHYDFKTVEKLFKEQI